MSEFGSPLAQLRSMILHPSAPRGKRSNWYSARAQNHTFGADHVYCVPICPPPAQKNGLTKRVYCGIMSVQ